MKELGGYLGLEQSHGGGEYYPGLTALNTARNALSCLCRAKGIRKLYIPAFLCDTASRVCARDGIGFEYYHIDEHFRPVFDRELKEGESLYLVNYYGQLSREEILSAKVTFGNIILDNVHAFFAEPLQGIDTVYSCRKFFGVPDGAYLASGTPVEDLETDCSADRLSHIYGRIKDGASAHYNEYKKTEASFYSLPAMLMSAETHALLADIDYDACRFARTGNYKTLSGLLGGRNGLKTVQPDGPYMYPFLAENGSGIRESLAERKIYIPTLWPNVISDGNPLERELARNILPLPCDQRYGSEDMKYLADSLLELI